MITCTLITNENYTLFENLLSVDAKRTLASQDNVYAVGALFGNAAAGVMTFEESEDIGHILYLYVAENWRRMGIATALLEYISECAKESNEALIAEFEAKDKMDPIYSFFNSKGTFSIVESEGCVYEFKLEELEAIRKYVPDSQLVNFPAVSFWGLSAKDKNCFYEKLRENEGLVIDPIEAGYENEICICTNNQKTRAVDTLIMVEGRNINFVWCDKGNEVKLIVLLRVAYELAKKKYSNEDVFTLSAINEASMKLAKKLIPTVRVKKTFYTAALDLNL